MAPRVKEKGLELMVRFRPGVPEDLVGDPGRIRQVVTNLVGNAVKFTEQGYVLIDVGGDFAEDHARLRVTVTDTGIRSRATSSSASSASSNRSTTRPPAATAAPASGSPSPVA